MPDGDTKGSGAIVIVAVAVIGVMLGTALAYCLTRPQTVHNVEKYKWRDWKGRPRVLVVERTTEAE